MQRIPLYLKTAADIVRPSEPEYYLQTRNGVFFCRNHPFFQSDVPAKHQPPWLSPHKATCRLQYPKLPASALEYIVAFFHRVYEEHGSEAIVLLLWHMPRRRYRICVPSQKATVWESAWGRRSALDVSYEVPVPLPTGCILVASIHSHAEGAAYSSWTDQSDETYRDGIHVVCGKVDLDPPDFHLEFAIDGTRFPLVFQDFFQGYHRRRKDVPQAWLKQVQCTVNRPLWTTSSSTHTKRHGNGA